MRLAVCLFVCVAAAVAEQRGAVELLRQGIADHERGDLTRAVQSYQRALAADPQLTRARLNLSAALGELGRLDDAIAVLEKAPAKDRSLTEIRTNLALAYYRKSDLPRAIRELETLDPVRGNDLRLLRVLADCYLRSGAADKALAIIQPAAKAHPDDPDLTYQLGQVFIRTGRPDLSLEPLERVGKIANSADAFLLAGATALDAGQFQRGKADIESAMRLNPNIPGIWTWLGLARDRVSDEDGAKEAYRKALAANPQDFEANLHLGAVLYREREMQEAKPYLEKALALNPASPLALYAMALVRSSTNEVQRAVEDLEKLVRAAPDWVEPHVKLASLYYRLNRTAEGQRERDIVDKLKQENREQRVSFPDIESR